MVLWEMTLATAYFLGLKRTYRLALKIQRRVISPKYPKIRQFAHRRTRDVFDVALKVHRKIQERDLEAGRNLGNWILRWLDKAKPTANIRGQPPPSTGSGNKPTPKQLPTSSTTPAKKLDPNWDKDSSRHLFISSSSPRNYNMLQKSFPSVAMVMRPTSPSSSIQYRQVSFNRFSDSKANLGSFCCDGVMRKDIIQWIRQGPC